MTDWTVPTPRREALAVWYRNILVWKKMAIGSALTQFGEPFIYLLGLGYGLGTVSYTHLTLPTPPYV